MGASRRLDDDAARERFDAIWGACYGDVHRYALRRAPDAARDVTAEVFLVAWRRIGDVPDDALPWLLGVARRTIANARRADGRRRALGERLRGGVAPPAGDPSETLSGGRLAAAFARLPPRDREVLALLAWEGLDPGRAARALGCTRAALAVRLHRARRRLERELGGSEPARTDDPTTSEEPTA
ncbi:MAG: RNA polymerase sigma factor [Thermoleophilia bacterium]